MPAMMNATPAAGTPPAQNLAASEKTTLGQGARLGDFSQGISGAAGNTQTSPSPSQKAF